MSCLSEWHCPQIVQARSLRTILGPSLSLLLTISVLELFWFYFLNVFLIPILSTPLLFSLPWTTPVAFHLGFLHFASPPTPPTTHTHTHSHIYMPFKKSSRMQNLSDYIVFLFKLLDGIPFFVVWKSSSLTWCSDPTFFFHLMVPQLSLASPHSSHPLLLWFRCLSFIWSYSYCFRHQAFAAFHPTLFLSFYHSLWASLIAQLVKNLPAMLETWVSSLGWEDPLEKGKATHSSILFWRIPWTTVHGIAKSQIQWSNFHFTSLNSCSLLTFQP